MSDLAARLRDRIHREGPIPFDAFVEAALYDPDAGFFAQGGGAGRGGRDFVTSPEVGELFGVCVAQALDDWWEILGRPDPYLVVEVGAGRGVLARSVLRAAPRCASALRYILVERSAALRAEQRSIVALDDPELAFGPGVRDDLDDEGGIIAVPEAGPIVAAVDTIPAVHGRGVVLANELLDNLPFRIAEVREGTWQEVRVSVDARNDFVEVLTPLEWASVDPAFHALPDPTTLENGTRLPVLSALRAFLAEVHACVARGVVACIDYAEPTAELVARGTGWLRTFRAHAVGEGALTLPGSQDITIDIPLEAWAAAVHALGWQPHSAQTQATWLRNLGIDRLANEAAQYWRANAAVGDLAAFAARSRVHEADALTDPAGLGAHRVLIAHARTVEFPSVSAH